MVSVGRLEARFRWFKPDWTQQPWSPGQGGLRATTGVDPECHSAGQHPVRKTAEPCQVQADLGHVWTAAWRDHPAGRRHDGDRGKGGCGRHHFFGVREPVTQHHASCSTIQPYHTLENSLAAVNTTKNDTLCIVQDGHLRALVTGRSLFRPHPLVWNNLSAHIQNWTSLSQFKTSLYFFLGWASPSLSQALEAERFCNVLLLMSSLVWGTGGDGGMRGGGGGGERERERERFYLQGL